MPEVPSFFRIAHWLRQESQAARTKGDSNLADALRNISDLVSDESTVGTHKSATLLYQLTQMCNVPTGTQGWYMAIAQAVAMLNPMRAPTRA